jgi:hypothetical protein
LNFGEASRHLESTRAVVRRASERLQRLERADDVMRLESSLPLIDEAQRLAGQLDQTANARAAEAARTIEMVLETSSRP